MQLESKFSLQNGAQDKLIWSFPVPSYSFLRANSLSGPFVESRIFHCCSASGERQTIMIVRINTAAVPTNTNMKEHNLCVLFWASECFHHSLCHLSCFRAYFQLYQPQWISLEILFCYAILLLTEKSERVRPAFKGMHTLSASMKSIC